MSPGGEDGLCLRPPPGDLWRAALADGALCEPDITPRLRRMSDFNKTRRREVGRISA